MKITAVKTHVLQASLGEHGFGWSQRVTDRRQSAICVVDTDEGVQGVGEAFYFGGPAQVVATLIDDGLGPLVVGRDPMDTAVLWDQLYNLTRDQGQKGVTVSAISAIDIALWDIKGQALGLPVYKLLGGAYRTRARAYATGLYEPQGVPSIVDALVDEAVGYKEAGFTGMKLKVGYGLSTDETYVRAIREAIGDDVALMVDANHAYNVPEAIRVARMLADYDVYWFEEPIVPEDVDGYMEVRSASDVLIAGGECEYTRYGFRQLIDCRAVDLLQPDLCAAGGYTEVMKIVAMASAASIPVTPHVWGTNVGLAAALQLYAALPNTPERRFAAEPFFETDRSHHPFRDGVTHEQFALDGGYLMIPQQPGLGVSLDMDFVRKYAS
jgi:D-galactarolactone cycloisomerase